MLRKTESGQTLIMALALLAVGGLLVLPVLTNTFTNLNYNQTIECRTLNDYSADAGLQYATCEIYNNPGIYTGTPLSENFTINGRTVEVNAQYQGGGLFSISSTASGGGCGRTTIRSFINLSVGSFAYAVASKTNLTISHSYIDSYPTTGTGDIYANADIGMTSSAINGDGYAVGSITNPEMILGDPYEGADVLAFPSVYAELYETIAKEGGIYYGNYVAIGVQDLGPLYITGELDVRPGAEVTLTGPVYVVGDIKGTGGSLMGQEHVLSDGNINMSGGGFGAENLPVLIATTGDIRLVGTFVSAVVYAPEGTVDVVNVDFLYGAVGGNEVNISNVDAFFYSESLHGRTDLPGSELYPLTYTYD